jgi:hypothetical protein
MDFFSNESRKRIKEDFAEFFFQKYNCGNHGKYNSELILFNMKSWHMHFPLYMMIGMMTLPFPMAVLIYISLWVVFILFIYLK